MCYTDIQLKTFIHGMEVLHRKIIMRRDSVILSKSRNRLRQRRNLSDERIESENSTKTINTPGQRGFCAAPCHFSLQYASIPAKKCLAQHENSSLPVASPVGGIHPKQKRHCELRPQTGVQSRRFDRSLK